MPEENGTGTRTTKGKAKDDLPAEPVKPGVNEQLIDAESGLYVTNDLPEFEEDKRPWVVIRASEDQAFDGMRWSGSLNIHQVRNLVADAIVQIISAENPIIVNLYRENIALKAENERLTKGMRSAGISPAPRRKKATKENEA